MASELIEAPPTAYVSNVQRFCVHDGPGIRTTVFLLGCPLRCSWCQNPEALDADPVLLLNAGKCAGCGSCVDACGQQAAGRDAEGRIVFQRGLCTSCGSCISACAFKARELSAWPRSVRSLLEEIGRDSVFYKNSGGGVTVSGGEPLLSPAFLSAFFAGCHDQGIHTALETCGAVPWSAFEKALPFTDLFLYDIKMIDSSRHARWTGVPNGTILENARALADRGAKIIVRVPLIPHVNDDDEEFRAIAKFSTGLRNVSELHLLPFHQVGSSKYVLAGIDYTMAGVTEENSARVTRCRQIAEAAGLRVSVGGAGF